MVDRRVSKATKRGVQGHSTNRGVWRGKSRQEKMKCKQADAEERKRSLESMSLTASCSGQ